MDTKEELQRMRKTNMKIYPKYKKLAWDYLFYYTIDFLFLTQVKNLSSADVVLASSVKSLFGIVLQIPANIIVEFLGRKNSVILGNILNCLYIVMFMMTGNIYDLILAKFISSLAFSLKDIAEPSILNSSIPPSKYKSNILAKINAKGTSGYYMLGAFSKIIGAILFEFNTYLPFILSLTMLVVVTIMSMGFIEPVKKKEKTNQSGLVKKQLKNIEEGFKYILKSNRLKALIIAAALIVSLLSILINYHTSILQYVGIPTYIIGFIAAGMSVISSMASKMQEKFHNKFRNKSLITLALIASISTIIAGSAGIIVYKSKIFIGVIIFAIMTSRFTHGMYYTLIDKYFTNFSNKDIDTKIFAVKNLIVNMTSAIMGFIASFLLDKVEITYCLIIVGIAFTIMYILMGIYMKTRVGLKPEEYSKEERKYDALKENV